MFLDVETGCSFSISGYSDGLPNVWVKVNCPKESMIQYNAINVATGTVFFVSDSVPVENAVYGAYKPLVGKYKDKVGLPINRVIDHVLDEIELEMPCGSSEWFKYSDVEAVV